VGPALGAAIPRAGSRGGRISPFVRFAKANFLNTVREGALACEATQVHAGRTTQVWDARVMDESSARVIALFRCTQLLLYPS
jgi:acyl-coenzyme A thioesterase PaaI-like protein